MKPAIDNGTVSSGTLYLVAALVLLLLGSLAFLISESERIGQPILGVPAGNWAAWAALISFNALSVVACRSPAWLLWPARLGLALAVVWYPVSVGLMGNPELSGADPFRGGIWLYYTLLLVFVPWLALLLRLTVAIARRLWRER